MRTTPAAHRQLANAGHVRLHHDQSIAEDEEQSRAAGAGRKGKAAATKGKGKAKAGAGGGGGARGGGDELGFFGIELLNKDGVGVGILGDIDTDS